MRKLVLCGLLLSSSTLVALRRDDGWKVAVPDYSWSFPEDHWAHAGYRTEWWYFTGHLRPEGKSESLPSSRTLPTAQETFGYQFTVFKIGLLTEPPGLDSRWSTQNLMMGHAAITDPFEGRHRFSELLYREIPLLGEFRSFPDPLIAWVQGPPGTADRWTLRWNGKAFDLAMSDEAVGIALDLRTEPSKPLVLQGPNGFSRKGEDPAAASQYYSFTRLTTEGELRVGKRLWRVRGESWMDKEFSSSQLSESQVGWDWFSLQLDDRREVMIYRLRNADGSVDVANGTLVPATGDPRYLQPEAWRLRATREWTSPETGATYPMGWRLEIPEEGLWLELEPVLADQENDSQLGGLFYWEGAVRLRDRDGRPAGRGYVELTGYGKENRPPL